MDGLATLHKTDGPAIGIVELAAIDVILLSHEFHPDNLDPLGITLLNGRRVLTTVYGKNNLKKADSSKFNALGN